MVSGAPEWIKCDLIETHTTGKGGDADDTAIIEELHNKIMKQSNEIEQLREQKKTLADKISKNYLADILKAVNLMEQGLREKKHKMEQIESGLSQVKDALAKMEDEQ